MKRREFLTLGAAGVVGAALGRSMVTVPSLWCGRLDEPSTFSRLRTVDDPSPMQIGDLIRRADGVVYAVNAIERNMPVGHEVAIVSPTVLVSHVTPSGAIHEPGALNRELRIYRHRFEHDGAYFHVGTTEFISTSARRSHTIWQKADGTIVPGPFGKLFA